MKAVDCGKGQTEKVNHAIIVVGYGVPATGIMKDVKFWRIKNSWGPEWGERGYMRVERGTNVCGLSSIGYFAAQGVTGGTTAGVDVPKKPDRAHPVVWYPGCQDNEDCGFII